MHCTCQIIPKDVLERLSRDKDFTAAERQSFLDTAKIDDALRRLRTEAAALTRTTAAFGAVREAVPAKPAITVADCAHGTQLPGTPIANPGGSADVSVKAAFTETTEVANFYRTLFGRNSVDDAGSTLGSSVHYGINYNNAFWNGLRMTYGDGDGQIFTDFTQSTDVIAHELTHGVTQYTLQLVYTNQAGGLNESMSDVFGSMFRQWRKGQDVTKADWLIGADIMGAAAKARGFTCLRDMANPGHKHCLSPQPSHFRDYKNGMDPHESSGIANAAFYKAAMAIGGNSWEVAGKIWYKAMTGGASPNMKMKTFANRTRASARRDFAGRPAVLKAVDDAWKAVGL